ncbi:hypothetical protein SAMN05421751_10989 [Jhaorihella thermophila]|uniref:Uncharacterized protein n=2 Tax=Jhaorihella thermophila TaxID=488547 RepID=A0A1H5WZS3_9RHOB|nr:hypothetical protein SAMN05421751_10989 [Jhaorihella thermophila]
MVFPALIFAHRHDKITRPSIEKDGGGKLVHSLYVWAAAIVRFRRKVMPTLKDRSKRRD